MIPSYHYLIIDLNNNSILIHAEQSDHVGGSWMVNNHRNVYLSTSVHFITVHPPHQLSQLITLNFLLIKVTLYYPFKLTIY